VNRANYGAMSYDELRHYFLTHRTDKAALQAYLDRRRELALPVITTIDDPDFDRKIEAAILQQVKAHGADTE
jgi:hypothetical protein